MARAVFFGTPDFSVPALEALADLADVALVVSQPDRPVGRGRRLEPTAVKRAAENLGLPVFQPGRLKSREVTERLQAAAADFFFTVAYGKIVPEALLAVPQAGCLNLHASILPRHRGSAPIQWALIRGDRVTGFTLMLMDPGMDTGPMLAREEIEILAGETAGELSLRMSRLAPAFMEREIPKYLAGRLEPEPQDHEKATYAPMLKKEDGLIDWTLPAGRVEAHVLGMNPWPTAYSLCQGNRLRILRASAMETVPPSLEHEPAGTIGCLGSVLAVRCGEGAVKITEIQAQGKRPMEASCFLRGCRLEGRFGG
jgi:methionyl-tRNA formyltransferase